MLSFLDFSENYQIGFQDPATPLMEGIIDLHHHIFFFLLVIFVLVVWFLVKILDYYYFLPVKMYYLNQKFVVNNVKINFNKILFKLLKSFRVSSKFTHSTIIEIVWTIIPSLILIMIAIPSFALLYTIDEVISPQYTVKVIGHQWYWSYENTDYLHNLDFFINKGFDSFMLPEDELLYKELRLLEVDSILVLPIYTHVRVVVTAADVLHSWAVPSLGVKIDAVPGRLNQTTVYIKRPGIYYGQCSEICGVNHGYMPIVIYAVNNMLLRNVDLTS